MNQGLCNELKNGSGLLIAALLLGAFSAGCKGSHKMVDPNATTDLASTASQKGFTEFQSGVYKWSNDQGCVKCHESIVTPKFANRDVNVAYAEAKGNTRSGASPIIDFTNPGSSVLITYAGNSHCGDAACSNPAVQPAIKSLIEAWVVAEKEDQQATVADTSNPTTTQPTQLPPVQMGPKFLTSSLPMPSTIPNLTVNGVAVLRFSGANLKPTVASLANAQIEIEIKMANASEYRFTRLKIAGNSAPVTITGIHIFLKTMGTDGIGIEDLVQGGGWNSVSGTAAVFALPATLPTTPLSATPITSVATYAAQLSMTDLITLGFDDVK